MKKIASLFLLPLLSSCVIHNYGTYEYQNSDKYSEYATETEIESQVKELSIDWVNGTVTVTKGESFSFSEESKGKPLYYWYRENKLDIRFAKNGTSSKEFNNFNKQLFVTVPYDLESLTIDIVNGNHQINLNNLNRLDVDVVNGSGEVELNSVKNILLDVVNGSGEYTIKSTSVAEIYDFDTVNGSITLNLDKSRGFDVNFKAVNGRLNNNFTQPESENNRYKINFDSTNGSLTINEIEEK